MREDRFKLKANNDFLGEKGMRKKLIKLILSKYLFSFL